MDEYIKRETAVRMVMAAKWGAGSDGAMAMEIVASAPAADVAPVVRCKDCKHSWEDIGGLCCSHGACVDLTVPGDFYCAYGERAEVTTICQSCGAMMDGEPCTPSK